MCLGVPMKVVELLPQERARVVSGNVGLEISTQLIDQINPGDFVLVHAGFAMEVLDMEAAEETLALLRELADAQQQERNADVDAQ
jgi:hydrogenase expression/formation protein HypC